MTPTTTEQTFVKKSVDGSPDPCDNRHMTNTTPTPSDIITPTTFVPDESAGDYMVARIESVGCYYHIWITRDMSSPWSTPRFVYLVTTGFDGPVRAGAGRHSMVYVAEDVSADAFRVCMTHVSDAVCADLDNA